MYLNHIEIRVYLYLYLIENCVFVFEYLGKSVFDPSPVLKTSFTKKMCLTNFTGGQWVNTYYLYHSLWVYPVTQWSLIFQGEI